MTDVQDCSHGGVAEIDGTIEQLDGMEVLQADLAYDLQDCRETLTEQYELTLHGVVTQVGPFENGGGTLSLQMDSVLLVYEGAAWSNETGQRIEQQGSCAVVSLLDCDDEGTCETTGTLCERAFDPVESYQVD